VSLRVFRFIEHDLAEMSRMIAVSVDEAISTLDVLDSSWDVDGMSLGCSEVGGGGGGR